jgi:hypothetical protein
MFSNRLAFGGLAVACVTAAGAGGYLASRQKVAEVPAVAAAAPLAPTSVAPSAIPVNETEAVVGSVPKPADLPPAAEPDAAPPAPRRTEQAPRATSVARAERAAPAAPARPSTPPPPLDRTWPSSAGNTTAAQESAAPSGVPLDQPVAPAREEAPAEPVRAPEPPEKVLEELVVAAESVIGLQTESALSSEKARVEDPIEARVVRDVHVGGDVAIPAGTRALGSVMLVEHGGRFKERARLGIRFHTLVLADGTRLPVTTDTIYRYGDAPGNRSAAKIGGGAVAGAILGAILGGAKGAAVGATAGAGGGTAAVMASDRSAATLPAGTEVTARILSPVTVTVER